MNARLPLPLPCATGGVRFSPKGTLIVEHDKGLSFWEPTTGRMLRFVESEGFPIRAARGCACLQNGALVLLDPDTGATRGTIAYPNARPPDDAAEVMFVIALGGTLIAFSLIDGRELYRFPVVAQQSLGPDVFVTREAEANCVRAVLTGQELWRGPACWAWGFHLSPDGRWLAIDTGDDVRFFELVPNGRVHTVHPPFSSSRITFEPGKACVYSSGPYPQSGNGEPPDDTTEVLLEDGPRMLPEARPNTPWTLRYSATFTMDDGRVVVATRDTTDDSVSVAVGGQP